MTRIMARPARLASAHRGGEREGQHLVAAGGIDLKVSACCHGHVLLSIHGVGDRRRVDPGRRLVTPQFRPLFASKARNRWSLVPVNTTPPAVASAPPIIGIVHSILPGDLPGAQIDRAEQAVLRLAGAHEDSTQPESGRLQRLVLDLVVHRLVRDRARTGIRSPGCRRERTTRSRHWLRAASALPLPWAGQRDSPGARTARSGGWVVRSPGRGYRPSRSSRPGPQRERACRRSREHSPGPPG